MSGLAEILARIPVEANQWFFQLGSVAIELLGAGTTEMDEHFCVTRRPLVADLLRHSSQAQSGANCWGHARLPSMVTAAFYLGISNNRPRMQCEVIGVSQIGSQADAMAAISADYGHWVNRTTAWIRRKGTKVWGLEQGTVRPDLNIQLGFINSVYALPGALRALEQGAVGH